MVIFEDLRNARKGVHLLRAEQRLHRPQRFQIQEELPRNQGLRKQEERQNLRKVLQARTKSQVPEFAA